MNWQEKLIVRSKEYAITMLQEKPGAVSINMPEHTHSVPKTQLSLDETGRQERLDNLGFREVDIMHAAVLQEQVIIPHVDSIVSRFYEFLLSQSAMRVFFDNPATIENLKHMQTDYLLTLGVNYDSAEYFETRMQVGFRHAEIKLPLSLYQCAFRKLQELIIDAFPEGQFRNRATLKPMLDYATKITALDMSLAIDAYHYKGLSGLRESVTQLLHRGRYLSKQLNQDYLTEVASRRYALAELQRFLDDLQHDSSDLFVLMADIDHFKSVNDQYGHLIGDKVLIEVAARICAAIRDVDLAGRYGGEEFIIILPDTDKSTASVVAERIRQRIAVAPIHLQSVSIPLTMSLGVARVEANDNIEDIIARADQVLYQAKQQGRDRIQVYQ